MDKKRALLVVAGGRAVPNILALHYLKPQLVRIILSEQGWSFESAFVDNARSIPGCQVDVIRDIDAYDFDVCLRACQAACVPDPDSDTEWDWIFEITSAPKVTGIAAYEVAKQHNIPCWHIDAQRERVVSLVKPYPVDIQAFFHLAFDAYMNIHHRTWKLREGPTNDYRSIIKKWGDIAREVAISPNAMEFLSLMHDKKVGDSAIPISSQIASTTFLSAMVREGLVEVTRSGSGDSLCRFISIDAAKLFGTGDWLEFYVWYEAIRIGITDEAHCQWGCAVYDHDLEREFDLALMYKAQLIVAECKAEQKPYNAKKNYLHKLDAVANALGGSYVCKIFITNQFEVGDNYKNFVEQAAQYKIVVVTAEKLADIGKILLKEATNPTYPRI